MSDTERCLTPSTLQSVRVCLVTPFAWSQPHDVNDHVRGIAGELRRRGHEVTVVAPSTKAADLLAGRRALAAGQRPEVIAVGAAIPVSRRSQLGVPVGVQANLRQALALGFDVVHGFEPDCHRSRTSLSATRTRSRSRRSSRRTGSAIRPHVRRAKLLGRVDALIALSEEVRDAAEERFPGDYRLLSPGVDTQLFAPAKKRKTIVLEMRLNQRVVARSVMHALRESSKGGLAPLRTRPLIARPAIPRDLACVHLRTARDARVRAPIFNSASIFVPGIVGLRRATLEAAAAGCAIARPKGIESQPDSPLQRRRVSRTTRRCARAKAPRRVARREADVRRRRGGVDELYTSLTTRRRTRRRQADPLADRPWIVADLHMQMSWSLYSHR